jgi:hypothetical protein
MSQREDEGIRTPKVPGGEGEGEENSAHGIFPGEEGEEVGGENEVG